LLAGAAIALSITVLISQIPKPAYRWSEELQARKEIGEFLRDDIAITRDWQGILDEGAHGNISFEEMAGRIDTAVGDRYEESFEQLTQSPHDPHLPSASKVDRLRQYAERRRDASRALAEGLRAHKPQQIRDALEMAERAPRLIEPGARPSVRKPEKENQD
jgi:rhomboid protease GluP